jgi:hypothetical protein
MKFSILALAAAAFLVPFVAAEDPVYSTPEPYTEGNELEYVKFKHPYPNEHRNGDVDFNYIVSRHESLSIQLSLYDKRNNVYHLINGNAPVEVPEGHDTYEYHVQHEVSLYGEYQAIISQKYTKDYQEHVKTIYFPIYFDGKYTDYHGTDEHKYHPNPDDGKYHPNPDQDDGKYHPNPDHDDGKYHPNPDHDDGKYHPNPDQDDGKYHPNPDYDDGKYHPNPDQDDGKYHPNPDYDDGKYHPNPDQDDGKYHPNPDYDDGKYHPNPDQDDGKYHPNPDHNDGKYRPEYQ